jgi:hypothetical protein
MIRPNWIRTAAVLIIFAAAFLWLTNNSITSMSATSDEPIHLTTGYLALKLRDYRIDPEHPPFCACGRRCRCYFTKALEQKREISIISVR